MNALRARLGLNSDREGGLTLVEVVVAMSLFAMISTGLVYTMVAMLTMSRDSRARQVATNLAAEEIDRARDVDDVTALAPWSTALPSVDPNDASRPIGPISLNGDVFHVVRAVEWVSDPDSLLQCGASLTGETLRYKKVNVSVTWDGMHGATKSVRSDTVINPRARINDPNKGTILISVLNAGGTGAQGVAITTSPTLSVAPSPSDARGCSYLLKVPPGTYSINLSKTGYVDEMNVANPSKTGVVVTAGSTTSLRFQYDLATTYSLSYPVTLAPTSAVKPTVLQTSYINTFRTHVAPTGTSHAMHPWSVGYTVVAGDARTCPAADPSTWAPSSNGTLVTSPLDPYAGGPGEAVGVVVPMGVVTVTGITSGVSIRATAAAGSVHVACDPLLPVLVYNFPAGASKIALPYGSWALTTGGVPVILTRISVTAPSAVSLLGVVTLDPRAIVVP